MDVNGEVSGRKRSWPVVKHHPRVCLDGLYQCSSTFLMTGTHPRNYLIGLHFHFMTKTDEGTHDSFNRVINKRPMISGSHRDEYEDDDDSCLRYSAV
jgi:hypothetical protein